MNYNLLYTNLITTRQALDRVKQYDGTLERHHIIPVSLGGSNDSANLVLLTPREHFIAHWLLYKIHTGKDRAKMAYAFFRMCSNNPNQKRIINSRLYYYRKTIISKSCTGNNNPNKGKNPFTPEQLIQMSESKKGENNPQFGKPAWNKGLTKLTSPILLNNSIQQKLNYVKENHPQYNIPRSQETKKKISEAHRGKPKSEEHKQKLSIANTGKKLSTETRLKMSDTRKGRVPEQLTCPHCCKVGASSAMYRWHFDRCKLQPHT